MMLEQYTGLMNLIGAIGVVAGLLHLAYEIRKNSIQAGLANWHSIIQGLREHKRRIDSRDLADVIARGRRDFDTLADEEKLMFGAWMEEFIMCYEAFLVFGTSSAYSAVSRADSLRATANGFGFCLRFPGALQWWDASGLAERWPKHLVTEIEKAVGLARAHFAEAPVTATA